MKIFGWDSVDDIARGFAVGTGHRYDGDFKKDPAFPKVREIIIADLDEGGYEGSAFVLYRRDGKLFEVHGGHCSCHGFEGQWDPEETTWDALAMRRYFRMTREGRAALDVLITKHASRKALAAKVLARD